MTPLHTSPKLKIARVVCLHFHIAVAAEKFAAMVLFTNCEFGG